MTKKDAASKIAKLRRLADDARTPPTEAEAARGRADKLAAEHGLGATELESGRWCAAFDDLVTEVEKIVHGNPNLPTGMFGTEQVLTQVLGLLRGMQDGNKATRLRQIVGLVQTASFFAGSNKTVVEIKSMIDIVLKNHQLTP
jgi:hypothetical protein